MEWVFLIVLTGALTYTGVEMVKHFYPSWYDRNTTDNRAYLHEKIDALHDDVKTLVHKLASDTTNSLSGDKNNG